MQNLRIITLRDLETERVSWLWEPYIPLGKITIIQGDPGDGKTTLALAIAAAVTRGEEVGGRDAAVAPGSVIFQTAEDGLADTVKPRLEAMGADCGRVHVIDESEVSLSLADDRIERAINEKDAKLFVLDPLQAYLGGADMHSVNGVRPLMKSLADTAGRTACAIVVIGHLNKKGGKAQYRGLGSIDIYAAARSVLTVGRIPLDENMRAIVHGKSNLAAPGASLAFGLDDNGGFTWLGDYDVTLDEIMNGKPSRNSQFDRAKRLIKNALANGAGRNFNEARRAVALGLAD
jgi:energy-coupling factor transporter ATP-binding protein EcfA2